MGQELTTKQLQAVQLLSQHLTSKEIARTLGIAPSTVDQRLAGAMRKLAVSNRRELARAYGALSRYPSMELLPASVRHVLNLPVGKLIA